MSFYPLYSITNKIANELMKIQESATTISLLPLPGHILTKMQKESLIETVIYSTKIEGNFLEENKKRRAISKKTTSVEEQEVYNLWKAMEFLQECEERKLPITEELIKKTHAIINVIPSGRRAKLSQYRSVQNKVGEAGTDKIIYLPPEAKDVPDLMEDLVAWINAPETLEIPVPIRAGIFMYQFLTIHPYMDGNGRTARALATYILRTGGYGLNGLFVLEKYYDRNLKGYYDNLQMKLNHNYYFGRNNAEITPWLNFFIAGLADVFNEAAEIVREKNAEAIRSEPDLLKALDVDQRAVFAQLAFNASQLSTSDLQKLLRKADRTVREYRDRWIAEGFIMPIDPAAKRIRAIQLAPKFQVLADDISSEPDKYKYLLI